MTALQRNQAARKRHQIELGGLVVKAGIVDLTGGDRAIILAALIWMADKLQSEDSERARELWVQKGKAAFADEHTAHMSAMPKENRDK
ncbi:conjugal transfer TraD family protein [Gluconobacter oxydans]|nr:conjugal transfer TraD family protein [Gluconobacter oxydans H24]ANQ42932.1 conjugal transfer TraD family protein [Gluconobacter oxydans]